MGDSWHISNHARELKFGTHQESHMMMIIRKYNELDHCLVGKRGGDFFKNCKQSKRLFSPTSLHVPDSLENQGNPIFEV